MESQGQKMTFRTLGILAIPLLLFLLGWYYAAIQSALRPHPLEWEQNQWVGYEGVVSYALVNQVLSSSEWTAKLCGTSFLFIFPSHGLKKGDTFSARVKYLGDKKLQVLNLFHHSGRALKRWIGLLVVVFLFFFLFKSWLAKFWKNPLTSP